MTRIFVMDFGRGAPVSGAPIVKRIILLAKKAGIIVVVIKRTLPSSSLTMSHVI
jgi:hypothetical protein